MYKNVYFWYFNKDGEFEFSENGTAPIEVVAESPAIRINNNDGVPPQYVITMYDVYDLVFGVFGIVKENETLHISKFVEFLSQHMSDIDKFSDFFVGEAPKQTPHAITSLADLYFKNALDDILENGVDTRTLPCADVRTRWADGEVAHYTYVTNKYFEYDLSEGYFPLISYRPQAWKSAIKEILWIYQDQSNELELLKDKHNITWWNAWESKDRPGTIGQRYGATIKKYDLMNKVLDALKTKGSNRRVIMDMLQYTDLEDTDGLYPCAYSTTWNVRGEYLDMLLNQRSSDFLTAWSINQAQYAALLIMVATAVGLKPGKFSHMIGNLHIYDRHIEAAKEMSSRSINPENYPKIEFEPDYIDFYSFVLADFRLVGHHPNPEQIKLEIAE